MNQQSCNLLETPAQHLDTKMLNAGIVAVRAILQEIVKRLLQIDQDPEPLMAVFEVLLQNQEGNFGETSLSCSRLGNGQEK